MIDEPTNTYINPIYFRVIPKPNTTSDEIYLLIHGWSGNELSMSIFSSSISDFRACIFPRAAVSLGNDEYAWVEIKSETPPKFQDYAEISKKLFKSTLELIQTYDLSNENSKINIIGFSQGAAIGATLSLLYPDSFKKVALLAGFLPSLTPVNKDSSLSAVQYYIAHGTEDKLVDFNKSLELKTFLEEHGAKVLFCKEDIGHKIGKSCLRNLNNFFST